MSDFQILQQQGCHGIDQASQSHFGEDGGVGVGTRQGRGEEMVALQGPSQWWFFWSLTRTLSHQRVEVPGLPVSVTWGCLFNMQVPGLHLSPAV